jgi:hypothetical protein
VVLRQKIRIRVFFIIFELKTADFRLHTVAIGNILSLTVHTSVCMCTCTEYFCFQSSNTIIIVTLYVLCIMYVSIQSTYTVIYTVQQIICTVEHTEYTVRYDGYKHTQLFLFKKKSKSLKEEKELPACGIRCDQFNCPNI